MAAMRKRWPWIALLLLLAAIIVVWLIPKPARVREAAEAAPAVNAPAPAAPQNEPPETPVVPTPVEAEPPKEEAPVEPSGLSPWKPLPSPPTQTLRKATEADLWFGPRGDEAEKLAAIPTKRFRATISGKVWLPKDYTGGPIRVWAESLGEHLQRGPSHPRGSGPPIDPQLEGDRQWRYWVAADPRGETYARADGTFTLDVEVTGADRAQLIKAAEPRSGSDEPGKFVARLKVMAAGADLLCIPAIAYPIAEGVEYNKASIRLFAGPFWECRAVYDDNTPAANTVLFVETVLKSDGRSLEKTHEFVLTDENGLIRVPKHEGLSMAVTAWSGIARGAKVELSKEQADQPPAQIVLPRVFTTLRKVNARVRLEDGAAPKGLVYGFGDGQKEALIVVRDGDTGWWRIQFERPFEPKEDMRYRATGQGFGLCEFTMQAVPPGMVLEVDAIVLPGPRTARLTLVDAEGMPLGGATVTIRVDDFFSRPGQKTESPTALTDELGNIDIEVLPGREYRILINRKEGGASQVHTMAFTSAGPHEIKWKPE